MMPLSFTDVSHLNPKSLKNKKYLASLFFVYYTQRKLKKLENFHSVKKVGRTIHKNLSFRSKL